MIIGCAIEPADTPLERDASFPADGGSVTDALVEAASDASVLDVGACPGLGVPRAPAASAGCGVVGSCAALIDAPTFSNRFEGTGECHAAREAGGALRYVFGGPLEIEASCADVLISQGIEGYFVHFGGHALAAEQLVAARPTRMIFEARTEGESCTRRLSIELERGGMIELLDLPPDGATVPLERGSSGPRDLTITTLATPDDACARSAVCVSGDLFGTSVDFTAYACGAASLPIGGCGDPIGIGIVGRAACGARISAAFFTSGAVPICH